MKLCWFLVLACLAQQLHARKDDATCLEAESFHALRETTKLSHCHSLEDYVFEFSRGHPDAAYVLLKFIDTSEKIDPDAAGWLVKALYGFDSPGILGSKIWILYNEVCDKDIICVHTVTRAMQLGIVSHCDVYHAMEHHGEGLDFRAVLQQVQQRVTHFLPDQRPDTDPYLELDPTYWWTP